MLEARIRRMLILNMMQFGFMLKEYHKRKRVVDHMCFVDLKIVFNRVQRNVMEWGMKEKICKWKVKKKRSIR